MLGHLPDLLYFRSLTSLMRSLFVMQVKQDLVAQIGMNATFVGLVEAEIQYVLLFFQSCCQPPKFLMEEGIVIKSEDLLLEFSSAKTSRSADDMKGFLALRYSLKRASLKASQSWSVAMNSGRFCQSLLSSSAR